MADYAKMKNSDLESLLKERGLPHNGRKAEMVARLQEADKGGAPAASTIDSTSSDPAGQPATTQSTASATSKTDDKATAAATAPAADSSKADNAVDGGEAASEEGKTAATFTANLATTSVDEEIARRKKRAEKFGMTEQESDAIRNLERQKRFGTGPTVTDTEGVNRLDEALPERRKAGAKRGREEKTSEGYDDPGLKRQRGRGRGRGARGPASGGRSQRTGQGGSASWMSEADKSAAEKRKAKFG